MLENSNERLLTVKNKITDLRDHLFATIEGLLDEEKPMEIDRAKAVAEVAQVIVNSAKIEVEYVKATQQSGTGFISDTKDPMEGLRPKSLLAKNQSKGSET